MRRFSDWLAADWSLRHPGNAVAQQGLNTHFARLLEESFAAYQLNDNLVAKARAQLRSESLAAVVYRMLRDQARNLPDYRLNTQLGPQASLFVGGDYTIPGFYTQRGYHKLFVAQGRSGQRDTARQLGTGRRRQSQHQGPGPPAGGNGTALLP